MKKTVLMLAAAGLMLVTPSCKKGENDPFLSLSSRKSRVAGTWDMTNYEFNSRNDVQDGSGDYQTYVQTMDGNTITSVYTDVWGGTSTAYTSTITVDKATWTFEKDGTWTSEMKTTSVTTWQYTDGWGDSHTVTSTDINESSESGNWSFVGKVKGEYKNKERMVMNTLSSSGSNSNTEVDANTTTGGSTTTDNGTNAWTENYHSGEVQATYEIDQLKGKEMILKSFEENSGTSSFTIGGVTNTSTDDVYTSDETITLSIVK